MWVGKEKLKVHNASWVGWDRIQNDWFLLWKRTKISKGAPRSTVMEWRGKERRYFQLGDRRDQEGEKVKSKIATTYHPQTKGEKEIGGLRLFIDTGQVHSVDCWRKRKGIIQKSITIHRLNVILIFNGAPKNVERSRYLVEKGWLLMVVRGKTFRGGNCKSTRGDQVGGGLEVYHQPSKKNPRARTKKNQNQKKKKKTKTKKKKNTLWGEGEPTVLKLPPHEIWPISISHKVRNQHNTKSTSGNGGGNIGWRRDYSNYKVGEGLGKGRKEP